MGVVMKVMSIAAGCCPSTLQPSLLQKKWAVHAPGTSKHSRVWHEYQGQGAGKAAGGPWSWRVAKPMAVCLKTRAKNVDTTAKRAAAVVAAEHGLQQVKVVAVVVRLCEGKAG